MLSQLTTGRTRRVAAVALAGGSLVTSAAVGSIFLSTARDALAAAAASGPASPADGILLVTGIGGALLSLWLGLGVALSALSALPGALGQLCGPLADQVAPAAVRKAIAFVLGTTLTAAFVPGTTFSDIGPESLRQRVIAGATHTVSALADGAPDASFRMVIDPPPGSHDTDAAPLPAWTPDEPASPAKPTSPAKPPSPAKPRLPTRPGYADGSVVVHRGDTLWSIAERHLGPAATATEIDVEWHRWLAANRNVIGDDANLILPGQLLSPPSSPRDGS